MGCFRCVCCEKFRRDFVARTFAQFRPFCTEFRKATKWYQVVQNATKCQFRVRWGVSGAFVAKNSDATSCHELLPKFGQFCTEFGKATKRSRMHPNSTKCTK